MDWGTKRKLLDCSSCPASQTEHAQLVGPNPSSSTTDLAVNANGIPFWGGCTTHFTWDFSGEWDVHWGGF